MHQLDNSQLATSSYFTVLEGALAPGTLVHNLLAPRRSTLPAGQFWEGRFRGTLKVDGLKYPLPEQDFSFHFTETGGYIESLTTANWPVFRIDLIFHPVDEQFEIKGFNIASADNTVEAGLLYTRIVYAVFTSGKFYLEDKIGGVLEIVIDKQSLLDKTEFLQAKLFRKLKYIESIFDVKFHVPEEISKGDGSQIEVLFRGITEGEFTVRSGEITFCDYTPSVNDLNGPPFTEPGIFTHTYTDYKQIILNQELPVGSVTIHLDHAIVANSHVVDKLRAGDIVPQMRLIVFDRQIKYLFEKYTALSAQARQRNLEQFKKRFLKEDPEALIALLDEPFAPDVSADEARRIVIGWLQYNMFPDRFCPQEPSQENNRWLVPVWVTAPRGQGGWVQDIFVDLKTGVVSTPMSVEELKALGKSVAAETLRAS